MKRFQNRIAESRTLLLFSSLYGIVIWLLNGVISNSALWITMALFILNTYLVVELNNRNTLLRTYSRMVSSSYIFMMLMAPTLLINWQELIVQFCILAHYTLIFKTYQNRGMMGITYFSYLFIGISSTLWPPMLYALPLIWFANITFLLSMNFRCFIASLLGILTPYWIATPIVILYGRWDIIDNFITALLPSDNVIKCLETPYFQTQAIENLSIPIIAELSLFIILAVISIGHFYSKSYEDKIQVRMLYNIFTLFVTTLIIVMAGIFILPFDTSQHFGIILFALILNLSPLVAHYITFTHSRLSNISAIIIFLIIILLTVINTASYHGIDVVGIVMTNV